MGDAAPAPASPPPAAPPRRRRRWPWLLLLAIVGPLVVGVALVAWLLGTPQGARFALDRGAGIAGGGVHFEGVEGRIGGLLRIATIEVSRPDLYARIENFEMDTDPFEPLRGSLLVHRLRARSVEVRTASTEEAARLPTSFAPPYPVRLEDGSVGELRLGALSPEAQRETDLSRRRSLIAASRDENDVRVENLFLRGAGTPRQWTIDEARAETAYGKGTLAGRVESAAPFAVALEAALQGIAAERPYKADVAVNGTLRSLEARLEGEVSGQPATGRVVVEPFAAVPVRALQLKASDVDLSRHLDAPRTRLGVEVSLAADGRAFAGPVRIDNAEPGPWDREQLPFRSATARVVVTQERLDVADLDVALAGGGSARGRAVLQRSGVEADLRVADVDLAALHGGLQKTRMTGRVAVAGDRDAQRFDVGLRDPRFEIDARAGLAGERLDVETVRVQTGGGAVVGKGTLSLAARREFRFEGRAEHFDPSAFVKTAKGDLNFTFVASGNAAEPLAVDARLRISPSTYAGLSASGRVDVAADRRRIARADVDVVLGEAHIGAKGSFGGPRDAMDVVFRVPNLSVLAKPFGVAMAGRADGRARLTGTFQSPAGRISLNGSNLALPSNVFVRELKLRAEAGVEPSSPIEADLEARGIALGEERPPTPFAEAAQATLRGTRARHRLEASAEMTRATTMRLVLAGGLDARARAPQWDGRVESLAMTGRGAFSLTQPTTLAASASRVELGEALLRGEWGEARVEVLRWTPRTLDFRGSTAGVEIQNVARSLRLGNVRRSTLVLAGAWDVRAAETFNATLDLHRVSGDLRLGQPPLPLGLQELSLKLAATGGRARANVEVRGDRVGRLRGEGSATIVRGKTGWEIAPAAPVEGRLLAEHTNLEALAPWLGADAKLGGRMNADVRVSGTGADPRVSGQARAEGLTVREPQSGFEVENGMMAVRVDGRSLTIEQFTATAPWRPSEAARARIRNLQIPEGGGTITAEGSVDLGERKGTIRVLADKVPVTQLPTRFLAMSGEARLEASAAGMLVEGAFKADAGWVGALATPLPSVSDDVVVVRAAQPEPEPAEEGKGKEAVRLDVRFGLGDRTYFQGRGLDTRLAGEIHLTGTPGTLRATGIIRTVGGTYDGYGQKLAIERGVLAFQGPLDNPQLNVLALRKGLPVEAGVEVLGTTTRPRVRLVSTPDVPEPEKLSWLVLGRGAADASLGDSAVMLAAAQALLGGNNPGADLTKRLGFDEIKIGRADANSILGVLPQSTVAGRTGSPSAAEVVSVGRRVNRNFHLTYEQGLADAEGALKLTWRLTRQFQLLVRAGYLPGLDAVYRWTFE